ncbi:monocarboxylate permease [Cordyceps fumosorosea ARSEF 2679]|uniref:Monocarboxylate permease n=1 Tax=Cordyceps fumosorosea (strain ARSEF 2679) TaxID=1081104 RepID=A0A162M9W3_CORFA|nr:monocarboxylate permease [Cordyceps fumosorosea ARSEF 2679]OAA53110.1 monocarboxylate permease [Cordyceps fumosorosea ARSEF 2679]
MASSQTTTTTIHLKDYDSSSTSAPINTGTEAVRHAALNTSTTARRRGAQPTLHVPDNDEDAIIAASRALDEECPDGGYGWVIVLSGAMLMWWASGTTYAWGVVQRKLVEQHLAGPATLSFIGSLQASMPAWFAVLDAFVMRRWLGSQRLAMLGMLTMGLGGILASFCTESIPGLFVTFGFLAGAGGSCGFAVVAAVPAQYFNTKRGLANGLIFAGSGFGGATNSFFMDALIRSLGIAWAFRVLGLVTMVTGLFAGWFMKERTKIPDKRFVDMKLFKNTNFTLLWLCAAVGNFPIFVPPFFLPLYNQALGFSSSTGAGLVAGFTLSSAIGRILCGFCCDRFGPVNVLLASLLLSAFSMLVIWPVSQSLAPLAIFCILNGVSNGGFFSCTPTVATSIFGSQRGSPIAGYLLEAFGGASGGLKAYRPAMFYAGGLALISAVLLAIVRFRINKKFLAAV